MAAESAVPVFAAVGGAVMAVLAVDGVTPLKAIGMVLAGAILGAFVVPGLAEYAGIESLKLVSALSCLVGMLGLQFVRVLTQQFDGIARKGIAAAARRAGIETQEGPP